MLESQRLQYPGKHIFPFILTFDTLDSSITHSMLTHLRCVKLIQAPLVALLAVLAISVSADQGVENLPICYDFGCKTQVKINITEPEWQSVAGWFHPRATTAEAERRQIRQAIGWMEAVVGRHTPTHRDKALNLEHGGKSPGQMDCIDESLNVTQYLSLFESRGLLRWHRVVERAYRRALFDDHWASQIESLENRARYVVDGWFQDNGYLPLIEPTEIWRDLSLLGQFTYPSN